MPVTLTVTDGVAKLTLERATKRNALDRAMLESLRDQVTQIATRDDVHVVVLRGAGGTFCAGADIADWVSPPHDVATDNSKRGQDAFAALAALPVTSVAVVEGTAIGGGLELALACDLRIATDDALLGLPELSLGNLPAWGGVARIADIAGLGVARHLLLSGELISGRRAAALLLVTSAHTKQDLDAALDATIGRILTAEPTAVRLAKQVLGGLESAVPLEAAIAGYTAGLDSSRLRKQDFLDQKAAVRAAKAAANGATAPTAAPPIEGTPS